MAKVHEIIPIYPVDGGDDKDFSIRNRPIGSGETFKRGAFLVDGGNGAVDEAGTNPAAILGVSLAAAADYAWQYNTLGTVVPSMPFATADQEFRGSLAKDDAIQTPQVTADVSALIGATRGVTLDTDTGHWVVDGTKSSSNQRVTITAVEGEDGDSNIPVRFTILPANRVVIS